MSATFVVDSSFLSATEYAIKMLNPDPAFGSTYLTHTGAIRVVPAPQVFSIAASLVCTTDQSINAAMTGVGFVAVNGVPSTIFIDAIEADFVSSDDCTTKTVVNQLSKTTITTSNA